jgi:hypothetical protein
LPHPGAGGPGLTHLNFFSFYFNMFKEHIFRIRGGGKAALLLAKPTASGDAGASPQGGRKKMRLPWPADIFSLYALPKCRMCRAVIIIESYCRNIQSRNPVVPEQKQRTARP